jgi:hypothetical protein
MFDVICFTFLWAWAVISASSDAYVVSTLQTDEQMFAANLQ